MRNLSEVTVCNALQLQLDVAEQQQRQRHSQNDTGLTHHPRDQALHAPLIDDDDDDDDDGGGGGGEEKRDGDAAHTRSWRDAESKSPKASKWARTG